MTLNDEGVPLSEIVKLIDSHKCGHDHYVPSSMTGKALVEYLNKVFAECDEMKFAPLTDDDIKQIRQALRDNDVTVGWDRFGPCINSDGESFTITEEQANAFRRLLEPTYD